MVLYFLEQARCPYTSSGLAATHCGPFNDDFETVRGWSFSGGSANAGRWQRAVPVGSSTPTAVMQRADVPSGQAALVTGANAGSNAAVGDVDGATSATSRRFKLGTGDWTMTFSYSFAHDATATGSDKFVVSVVTSSAVTPVFVVAADGTERAAAWQTQTIDLSAFSGKYIRLRVRAVDGGADSLVEAAIDDIRVFRAP
jgi:aminopeptidase S